MTRATAQLRFRQTTRLVRFELTQKRECAKQKEASQLCARLHSSEQFRQ